MRGSRYTLMLAVAIVVGSLAGSTALAQCNLDGYTSHILTHSPALTIPDGFAPGINAGTILTSSGGFFTDVIAGLRVTHSFMGDLVATLTYDVTCDGTPEASAVLICRQGDPPACTLELSTTFGCLGDMTCTNNYLFDDEASGGDLSNAGADPVCTLDGDLAAGCFQPSVVAGVPLSNFIGLARGGCFKLQIADQATPDVGSVCEWSVHYTFDAPTPAQNATWGGLKTTYR